MRHGKKVNHLKRTSAHRKALMKNLANALVEHKRITTTLAKAKSLRKYIEPLITKARTNSTHSRRVVFSYLQNKEAVTELFGNIAEKIGSRPGGYVRIIKLGFRKSDSAEMALIEFVDFNDIYTGSTSSGEGKSKKKRTRRGGKKKEAVAAAAAATTTAAVVDEVVEEKVENAVVEEKVQETVEEKVEEVVAEEPAVEKAAAPVVEEAPKAETATPDDLTKIEGIGPKIAETLSAAGIATFAQLATSTPESVKTILENAEGNFAAHDPATWPKQAEMAAKGEWDALKKWQDELDGGKEVK